MEEIFGIPTPLLFGQLLLGLINGAFYALLSLGLAVIFGMLNVINFTHGAQFMMGAFVAWMLLNYIGIGYWGALILVNHRRHHRGDPGTHDDRAIVQARSPLWPAAHLRRRPDHRGAVPQ